jgi:ABC-type amino acid transport substrate-binding protein
MKKAKRILALTLAAVSCFWLAGCSDANNSETAPADEKPGYVILDGSLASEEYGIGFRKDDPTRDVVNAALQVLAADGTLAKIPKHGSEATLPRFRRTPRRWTAWIHKRAAPLSSADDSFPPMGYRDDKNEIVGFDIDMAKAVCEKLDWTLQLQPIDWMPKNWNSTPRILTASGTA